MTARRPRRHAIPALLALLCAGLALPAGAVAGTGGAGLAGGSTGAGSTPPVTAGNGSVPVSTTGGGVTLRTTSSAMLRRGLAFSGTAPAGRTIEIQRSGPATDDLWLATVQATVAADGSFQAVWNTDAAGRFAIRAIVVSQLATVARATPSLTVTVYRSSRATLYGPGFYGRRTACGGKLVRTTLGVANRTLRCGTSVSLYYDGRTLVVPVIDRGPYANGANWDLTMATGQALGMDGTEQIGAVSLPRAPTASATHRVAPELPGAQ